MKSPFQAIYEDLYVVYAHPASMETVIFWRLRLGQGIGGLDYLTLAVF